MGETVARLGRIGEVHGADPRLNSPDTPQPPAPHEGAQWPDLDPAKTSLDELLRSAVALFENDRYAEAAALFRYILVFRQRAACIWAWLGRCHEHSEQFEVAESIYQAALAVVPPSRACELRELALRVRWLRGLREAKVLGAGR